MIRVHPGLIVADGDDAAYLALAAQYARKAAVREGKAAPWLTRIAQETLRAAQRHDDDGRTPSLPPSHQRIDSDQAAQILGVSRRRVQALASELDGTRRGRRWWFDRDTVTAYRDLRRTHGPQAA